MRKVSFALAIILILSISVIAFAAVWTCPACGQFCEGNFCSNCGASKPASWVCASCGSESTGMFCAECGAARSRIDDQCGLFSEDEKREMSELISEIESKYEVYCLIVTSSNVPKDSSRDYKESKKYADTYYGAYLIGQNKEDGLLYLIDMNNRVSYVNTHGNVIDLINSERLEVMLGAADPSLAKRKYGKAAIAVIEQYEYYLSKRFPKVSVQYNKDNGENKFRIVMPSTGND